MQYTINSDGNKAPLHGRSESHRAAQQAISEYIAQYVPEFRTLCELRQKGWKSEQGDQHFARQRQRADEGGIEVSQRFYNMMTRIAEELQKNTNALMCRDNSASILDFCAAPGGFLATALRYNTGACAQAFSLAPEEGGHISLLRTGQHLSLHFQDITMLAADMGMTDIPSDHPDKDRLQADKKLSSEDRYDLVLCDGQVLRTQPRHAYREKREARRLIMTQLALGLAHIKTGGTMVVLLHKIESWHVVAMLYSFQKFSKIHLYKPRFAHRDRSSAYMIAKDIQGDDPALKQLVARYKEIWKVATFGNEEEYFAITAEHDGAVDVKEVLREFGPDFLRMGTSVWQVQAEALARKPYIKAQGPLLP